MALRMFCVAWPRWKERHMATSEKVESKKADVVPVSAPGKAPASPAPAAPAAMASGTPGARATAPADAAVKAVPAAAPAPVRERDAGRDKAIDLAVSTIEKQFGKGSIMRLGEGIAPP